MKKIDEAFLKALAATRTKGGRRLPNRALRAISSRAHGRKYDYLWVLQGNYGYGHGWEDLMASESFKDIRQTKREYVENEGGNYRIIRRRELRSDYQAPAHGMKKPIHGTGANVWIVSTGPKRAVSKRPGLRAGDPPQYDDEPAEYAEMFTKAQAQKISKLFPGSKIIHADKWLYG